jgi:hypothetical protein
VSKRHQANRRKAYGRRQHELQERRQRQPGTDMLETAYDEAASGGMPDRFSFLDARMPNLRYAVGD